MESCVALGVGVTIVEVGNCSGMGSPLASYLCPNIPQRSPSWPTSKVVIDDQDHVKKILPLSQVTTKPPSLRAAMLGLVCKLVV